LQYLTSLTGETFNGDVKSWSVWWRQNRDKFTMPDKDARKVVPLAGPDMPYYYGLPIYAQRVVFVMDTSNSMIGPRLAAAKRELIQAIRALPAQSYFAILVFNRDVTAFQKALVPADEAKKLAAISWVQAQNTRFMTVSFDALETAFTFDAEAIFFLSDGAPYGGKITDPTEIVQVITRFNRSRRESIHTIALSPGMEQGSEATFMRTLAEKNLGVYRRVNQ
jgi:uncharacterized protein YegL